MPEQSEFLYDMECVAYIMKPTQRVVFRVDDEQIQDTPIEFIGYSNRSQNALKRRNLNTIGQLLDNWVQIALTRNVGVKSISEIKVKFLEWYYATLDREGRRKFWNNAIVMTEEENERH